MPQTGEQNAEIEAEASSSIDDGPDPALSIAEPDFDASVGFASPGALAAQPFPQQPAQAVQADDLFVAPEQPLTPVTADPPHIHSATEPSMTSESTPPPSEPEPSFFDATPAAPAVSYEPLLSREERRRARETAAAAPADDRMLWAYTVYALILFSVPTLGVAAVIGVLAVTGRALRADEPVRSHYIFQQRTFWSAAVIALIGVVLIPIGLGVFVLFLLAVWILARGAFGLLRLKAGRPIDNPRSWLL